MDNREEQAVADLQLLVQDEPDLHIGNDRRILLRYLRFTHFNVNKAFEKMKSVYRHKADHSKWYAHQRVPELHDRILAQHVHLMLEDRDKQGRRIYLVKLANVLIDKNEPWEMHQVDDLWMELALDEEETQTNGVTFLIDMEAMPWKFMRYLTPSNVKVGSRKSENIPVHDVKYHVVNSGLLLNSLVSLIFPFLSASTKENIHFHKNSWSSLHQYIDPSVLPCEYGGLLPPLDYDKRVKNYLDMNMQRLNELLSYGYKTKQQSDTH